MKTKTKVLIAITTVVLGTLIYFIYPIIHVAMVAKRSGMLEGMDRTDYAPTTNGNLQALRTALSLYADSEGQYPAADGWMTAIENRLQTNNLKTGEGEKKLHSPRFTDAAQFGYMMNDACAGKYPGDIKDPKTVLVFDSSDGQKNAHGNPEKSALKGGYAITVGGDIIRL